jgi:hypothetical protein
MTSGRGEGRRGLPKSAARQKPGGPPARAPRKVSKKRRWISELLRTMCALFLCWVGVVCLWSAGFIGLKCYSATPATRAPVAPPPDGIPNYTRPEAFTYLTLPERYIAYSADEYAAFIATRPPSGFPYLGSIGQYWGFYSTACAATRRTHPFETGYHVMLGVIGASFTIESSVKSVYEHTAGWLTEWLSTTDTAEDAFAVRTAREYGTFMHHTPWYQFPFASRLKALWSEVPLTGPHMPRKLERRTALTTEYAIKTVYGFVIRKASGAGGEGALRIHARVADTPAAALSDPRIKVIQPLGPRRFVITLPRHEDFTATALALNAKGVRFTDVAGNTVLLITALARRGISTTFADAELVATAPILTDPTMQRLALRVRVASLREAVEQLSRAGAVIEHLHDY